MAKRKNAPLARSIERIAHLEGALAQNISHACELRRQLADKDDEVLEAHKQFFDYAEQRAQREEDEKVQDFIAGMSRCALDDDIVIAGGKLTGKHLDVVQMSIGNLRFLAGVLARRARK